MKWLLLIVSLVSINVNARTLTDVQIKISLDKFNEGDVIYVAYYLGEKQYVKDTLSLDKTGSTYFKSKRLNTGMYLVVLEDKRYVEFILNEPQFDINIEVNEDKLKSLFFGSRENELFQKRMTIINYANQRKKQLEEKGTTNEELQNLMQPYQKQLDELDKEIISQKDLIVGDLILAYQEPEIVQAPEGMDAEAARIFVFNQYKKDYFKNINFKKSFLAYTPILDYKTSYYLRFMTEQNADSICNSIDRILSLAQQNDILFKHLLVKFINQYAKAKTECIDDRVYYHIVKNYYSNGRATWVDDENKQEILMSANRLQNLLCGNAFPKMLFDFKEFTLYPIDVSKPLKVVCFMDSTDFQTESVMEKLALKNNEDLISKTQIILVLVDKINHFEKANAIRENIKKDWIVVDGSNHKNQLAETYNLKMRGVPTLYILSEDLKIELKPKTVYYLQEYLENRLK